MSVGHARTAIRRMLSIRGRRGWVGRLWAWIGLAVVLGLVLGSSRCSGCSASSSRSRQRAVRRRSSGSISARALARELQRMPAPGVERAAYPGEIARRRRRWSPRCCAAAIMLIPAVIAALRGIWVPTCDWWFGVESVPRDADRDRALAGALGARARGRRRSAPVPRAPRWRCCRRSRSPAAALYRFYAAPPVFTYNAILGYFPGNLYDENVQLGSAAAVVAARGAAVGGRDRSRCRAARLDVPRYRLAPRAAPGEPPARRARGRGRGRAPARSCCTRRAARSATAIDAERHRGRARRPARDRALRHPLREDADEIEARHRADRRADHEFRYAQVVAQLGAAPPGKLALVLLRRPRSEGALDGRARRRDGQAVAPRDLPRPPAVPAPVAAPRDRACGRERVRRSDLRRRRAARARRAGARQPGADRGARGRGRLAGRLRIGSRRTRRCARCR